MMLVVQILTGVVLAMHYVANTALAFQIRSSTSCAT